MKAKLLSQVKLFEGLEPDHLDSLANHVDEREVAAGKALVKEGESLSSLFIVVEGQIRLYVRDDLAQKVCLETLQAGDVFGELSLVTDEPAFIWAETLTTCRVGVLGRDDFRAFIHHHPNAAVEIFEILGQRTVRLEHAIRTSKSRDVHELENEQRTFGERVADGFAALIGSWPFILVQTGLLLVWVSLNVLGWVKAWDPYPFILLNLALSFQAAYAGPIIMMSQNRQGDKDRLAAAVDHQVNLKTELELSLLSKKVDDLEDRFFAHLRQGANRPGEPIA
jgi:uncharacterized membrane protein